MKHKQNNKLVVVTYYYYQVTQAVHKLMRYIIT